VENQTTVLIEWEGELSEQEISAISSDLRSLAESSVEIQTEKALEGMELVVSTIVIAMATRVGEKIVDAVWSCIKALSTAGLENKPKTLGLKTTWNNGEVKIKLPLDQQEQVKKLLDALNKLISAS
jgi:hypothetical protein